MPGARCTRSRACRVVSTRVSHHGRTGITRHSRTRMVLTVSSALSPVIGLFCHRHPCDAGVSGPKGRHRDRIITSLTPTIEVSGPHGFAVRNTTLSSAAPFASIASQPYVRNDRETPLSCRAGIAGPIWVRWEVKFLIFRNYLSPPTKLHSFRLRGIENTSSSPFSRGQIRTKVAARRIRRAPRRVQPKKARSIAPHGRVPAGRSQNWIVGLQLLSWVDIHSCFTGGGAPSRS